jgi:hypothetical protein
MQFGPDFIRSPVTTALYCTDNSADLNYCLTVKTSINYYDLYNFLLPYFCRSWIFAGNAELKKKLFGSRISSNAIHIKV